MSDKTKELEALACERGRFTARDQQLCDTSLTQVSQRGTAVQQPTKTLTLIWTNSC